MLLEAPVLYVPSERSSGANFHLSPLHPVACLALCYPGGDIECRRNLWVNSLWESVLPWQFAWPASASWARMDKASLACWGLALFTSWTDREAHKSPKQAPASWVLCKRRVKRLLVSQRPRRGRTPRRPEAGYKVVACSRQESPYYY